MYYPMRKALATLGVLLALWAVAGAATFTVTNTADSGRARFGRRSSTLKVRLRRRDFAGGAHWHDHAPERPPDNHW
jgi:hypothetical protein